MRQSAAPYRMAWVALMALLLGLRSLGSAGYMPALEHGRVALVLCPDGEWTAPARAMPGMDHRHGMPAGQHEQCPYAAAAAIPFAAGEAPAVPAPVLAPVCIIAFVLPSLVARALVQRPNQTGPPIPA